MKTSNEEEAAASVHPKSETDAQSQQRHHQQSGGGEEDDDDDVTGQVRSDERQSEEVEVSSHGEQTVDIIVDIGVDKQTTGTNTCLTATARVDRKRKRPTIKSSSSVQTVPTLRRQSTRKRSLVIKQVPIETSDDEECESTKEEDEEEDNLDDDDDVTVKKHSTKRTKNSFTLFECPHCHKVLKTQAGLQYHVDHKVCRQRGGIQGGTSPKMEDSANDDHPADDESDSDGGNGAIGKNSTQQQLKRRRGKVSKRTCPECRRVFTSSYGLSYHLKKKVCQPMAPSSSVATSTLPPPLYPTLKAGLVFCTKYGVVQVVADDRSIPTRIWDDTSSLRAADSDTTNATTTTTDPVVAAAAHLQRRLKVYYSACSKRDTQYQRQMTAVAVLSRARRMLLCRQQQQLSNPHENVAMTVSDVYRVDFGSTTASAPSRASATAPPLLDPSAPPEACPNRLVECIWLPDERARVAVAASGGTKGDVGLEGTATATSFNRNRTSRLFLQRRLLTQAYNAATVRYYCPHCWQCFLSRPGISYHGVGEARCLEKRGKKITVREQQLAQVEQHARQLAASFQAFPDRFTRLGQIDAKKSKLNGASSAGTQKRPRTIWVDKEESALSKSNTTAVATKPHETVPEVARISSASIASIPREASEMDVVDDASDKELVSPDDVLAQLEHEFYRTQGKLLGPMYPQVYKALGYRKPKKPTTRRRRSVQGHPTATNSLTLNQPPSPRASLLHPPQQLDPSSSSSFKVSTATSSLEPPLPFMERTPPNGLVSKAVIVDVRTLVREVDAGRYPTIQRNNDGVVHDGYCAICKYQVPPMWMTASVPVSVPMVCRTNGVEETPHKLISCDFCRRDLHLVCVRTKYILKEPERNEDFMCHRCIGIIIQRRNRAEKRRQEKAASRNPNATSIRRHEDGSTATTNQPGQRYSKQKIDLTKGIVAGSELECVAEQARLVGDLTELLRDAQSRLSILMTTIRTNQARGALLETPNEQLPHL